MDIEAVRKEIETAHTHVEEALRLSLVLAGEGVLSLPPRAAYRVGMLRTSLSAAKRDLVVADQAVGCMVPLDFSAAGSAEDVP